MQTFGSVTSALSLELASTRDGRRFSLAPPAFERDPLPDAFSWAVALR